jgi:hypothetical protein
MQPRIRGLKIAQVMRRYNVSRKTVEAWLDKGLLDEQKLPGSKRWIRLVTVESVERFDNHYLKKPVKE